MNIINNIKEKPSQRRPGQHAYPPQRANAFRSTSFKPVTKNICKSDFLIQGKLCIPQVRKSNLMAMKRNENMKIVAGKSQKLRVLGEVTQNYKNIANSDINNQRLRLRLQHLLRLTLNNMTKSKCNRSKCTNTTSKDTKNSSLTSTTHNSFSTHSQNQSNFTQISHNSYIQNLTNYGKNLVKAKLLSSTLRTTSSASTLRSSGFSNPSSIKLSRNQEGRSSCCGGRSSNSSICCNNLNTGSDFCCRSSANTIGNRASCTPTNGQRQFSSSNNCLIGFSKINLGLENLQADKQQNQKMGHRPIKSSSKNVRKGKNFVWNRKGKLRKIMDMFASFCENVNLNIEDSAFPSSKKLDRSQIQVLKKWLKLGFTMLSRDYEQVYDQHTDNLAHAVILYSCIKVQMSSTLLKKSIKPLAKRKKVSIKEVRASDSYKLFRGIIEASKEFA